MTAVEGASKSTRTAVFLGLALSFWLAMAWQMRANSGPATEEEIALLEEEGECEKHYVQTWTQVDGDEESGDGVQLKRSDVHSIRALCTKEAELAARRETE